MQKVEDRIQNLKFQLFAGILEQHNTLMANLYGIFGLRHHSSVPPHYMTIDKNIRL